MPSQPKSTRPLSFVMEIEPTKATLVTTISTLGELLEAFIRHETETIRKFESEGPKITHGPTIGNMYEGLTKSLLSKAIPSALNLRIANGFVMGGGDKLSGQIDCMLVKGEGRLIPNTDHEIVELHNVLAVFEVKKTLYGGALPDVLDHFHQLMKLDNTSGFTMDAEPVLRTFGQICGIHLEAHREAEQLPFHQQLVYSSLVSEHARPLRIAISYDGFKKESGFRKSFVEMVEDNVGKRWIPPTNWPDLIVSGGFSMIKLNGRPYAVPSRNGMWDLYGTTRASPIRLILELIYTRISKEIDMVDFWGDDLEVEAISPFLQAEAVQDGDIKGWLWSHTELTESKLESGNPSAPWTPFFCDDEESIALILLCNSPDGLEISEIEKGIADRTQDLVDRLTNSGLVARRGDKLWLTTVQARHGILPDGRSFFGEDNTGRLMRWVMAECAALKAKREASEISAHD
jgi:hypothetical protein